jgi:hypothetical protein
MTSLEDILLLKYKNMIKLTNINNISLNTVLIQNVSMLSQLNILGTTIISNSTTLNSNLYVPNLTCSNNTTLNSIIINNLGVSNMSTQFPNNVTVVSKVWTSGNGILNNINVNNLICTKDVTMLSPLNIIGSFNNNNIITSNIYGSNLYLNSNNINIGNQTSLIHINGTVNNILTNNLRVRDKFINLNYNESTNTGFDTGNLCGINILTNNSTTSYIRTSDDASRYELKTPSDITSKYILTTDLNNNLYISGNTTIKQGITLNSNLFVPLNSNLNNTSILSVLNLSTPLILFNPLQINGSTYIPNDANLGIFNTINNLCINDSTNFNNVSDNSLLLISNNTLINNKFILNSKILISNESIFNQDVSVVGTLYISNNSICNNSMTITTIINTNNNLNVINSTTVQSALNINTSLLYNTSCNSGLNLGGNFISNNNITLMSTITSNSLTIIGQCISNLPEYMDNTSALQAGLSLGTFYRTGGIIKIVI